jgi:hypothetical protein
VSRAYRSAAIRPLCSECGELADGSCPRCGRPLCSVHAYVLVPDRRCTSCEEQYDARFAELQRRCADVGGVPRFFLEWLVLIACFPALIVVGLALPNPFTTVLLLLWLPVFIVWAVLRGRDLELLEGELRRRFLAEEPGGTNSPDRFSRRSSFHPSPYFVPK